MKKEEKKMLKDIEKYVAGLKVFLKRGRGKDLINLGKPNDKHLRTYIKNWYHIKLLFPETMDFNIILNRRKVVKFIKQFEDDKEKIAKSAARKLNRTKEFILVKKSGT